MKYLSNKIRAIKQLKSDNITDCYFASKLLSKLVFSSMVALYLVLCSMPCEALTAGKVEINGLYSIDEKEFLDMFDLSEGSLIDRDKIRKSIKRVFLKGLFDDISVTVSEGEDPTVTINVIEKEFIEKIDLEGSSAIKKKIIKRLFLLKEGQMMRHDLVQAALDDLREKLSLYGFPDAEIALKIKKADEPYRINIILIIDTGSPVVIKKIKISIEPDYIALSSWDIEKLLDEMSLSDGDVYNQYELKEDMEIIKEVFKDQGFFKPVVGPYVFSNGELQITVNPGSHLHIKIEGNRVISAKKLMKEIPLFELEIFNDEVIEESISRMLSLYHKEGYAFSQIAPVIESDENNIVISFFIFEGKPIKISSIKFIGASLPHMKLKEVMGIKEGEMYNPDAIEKYKESLKEFYGAFGFLEAKVKKIEETIDKDTAELIVDIEEGSTTEIASIDITGVDPEIRSTLMFVLDLQIGDSYNEVDISDSRFRILDYYRNYGHTNIDVIVTRDIENHRASIVYDVIEGEKNMFGKTVIIGNKKTKYDVIKREFVHEEGQPYSFGLISNERQRLYQLGLFTDVDIEAVDGEGNKKDILVKVKEGKAGSVEFGFGYADYERFRGFVEVSYRNLWGMNRLGTLRAELSSLEERIVLQFREPWFMGIDLPFRTFFLYEDTREINVDDRETLYRLEKYSVTAGFEKKLTAKLKTDLYYEFTLVRTFDVQPDVILSKEDTGTLAISSIKPSLIYDTRDDPFEPQKGVLAGMTLKFASPLLFSESNFTKLIIHGSTFHKLIQRVVLAMSVRGGVAYGFGDTDELPIVERFFLGGRSTVRGYEQDNLGPKGSDGNPTGGNAFLMSNIELRTSISKSIGLVTFFDSGNVWILTKDIDPSDLKYTTGLGLRYKTPVGPLRVDYGVKLERETGESSGELHFSIGHAF